MVKFNKFSWILLATMILIIGCSNSVGGNEGETNNPVSIQSLLDSTDSIVDFANKLVSEDASLKSSKTIKNADFNGKTLTINDIADNVTLENVKNVNLIISKDCNANLELINCKNVEKVTFNGGSFFTVKDSDVNELFVNSEKLNVSLTDETTISKLEVTKNIILQGGKITKVIVKTDSSLEDPTITITGKTNIIELKKQDEKGNKTAGSVIIVENAKSEVDLPEDVEQKEIPTKVEGNRYIVEGTANGFAISKKTLPEGYIQVKVQVEYADKTLQPYRLTENIEEFNSQIIYPFVENNKDYVVKVFGVNQDYHWIDGETFVVKSLGGEGEYSVKFNSKKYDDNTKKIILDYELIGDIYSKNISRQRFIQQPKWIIGENKSDGMWLPTIWNKQKEIDLKYVQLDYEWTPEVEAPLDFVKLFTDEMYNLEQKELYFTFPCNFEFDYKDYVFDAEFINPEEWSPKIEYAYKFTAPVTDAKKESAAAINEGINSLVQEQPNFDKAISSFKKAYVLNPTDETKLYYALAKLGSISVNDSIAKIVKDNFGIKNYPNKLNALISGDWMKEYPSIYRQRIYVYEFEKNTDGYYVRVDGDEVNYWENSVINCDFVLDGEGDWISKHVNLKNVTVSPNGKYFVSYYYLPEGSYTEEDYYICNSDDYKEIESLDYRYKNLLPEFDTSFIENETWFNDLLFQGVLTSRDVIKLFIANILHCNPEGLNQLVDNCLDVFGKEYDDIKTIVQSMSNSSVEVPSKIIEALNLKEVFGNSTVKIGKTEANLLFVPYEVIKGIFQWISSYDFSANLNTVYDTLKLVLTSSTSVDLLDTVNKVIGTNTFGIRNANAIEESKKTFIDAIQTVCDTYSYIISEDSQYPSDVKNPLIEYGDPIYTLAKQAKSAIQDGTIFDCIYNGKRIVRIDMGKFFKPGYFSDIIKRENDDKIKFRMSLSYSKNNEKFYYDLGIVNPNEYQSKVEELETQYKLNSEDVNWCSFNYGPAINFKLIKDCVMLNYPESFTDCIILQLSGITIGNK